MRKLTTTIFQIGQSDGVSNQSSKRRTPVTMSFRKIGGVFSFSRFQLFPLLGFGATLCGKVDDLLYARSSAPASYRAHLHRNRYDVLLRCLYIPMSTSFNFPAHVENMPARTEDDDMREEEFEQSKSETKSIRRKRFEISESQKSVFVYREIFNGAQR